MKPERSTAEEVRIGSMALDHRLGIVRPEPVCETCGKPLEIRPGATYRAPNGTEYQFGVCPDCSGSTPGGE